jgi:ketosteroid isomerase-like protein
MSADGNLKTVRTIYDAFGRGDLASILDTVTDDIDWSSAAASRSARRSGKEAAMHLHHYWRFRDDKVAYWRGSEDTEQTATMLKR